MSKHRTLIIGLDGATFSLIDPWIRAGHLPTFSRLIQMGVHGPLNVWPNLNSAASWSSIVTGYNPGQHGVFNFGPVSLQGEEDWHPTTARDRHKDPFWRLLSAQGQEVGIINVPISYPADPVKGFMISGKDAPHVQSPGFTHPPDLYHSLCLQGIDYIINIPNLLTEKEENPDRMPKGLEKMIDGRTRTALCLMKTHPWDVMMIVFAAIDRVQHFYWPHPQASMNDPGWEPILKTYQKIDSSVKDMLALTDEQTTVLLVSDHGFGPLLQRKPCLNPFFARMGLLRFRQGKQQLKGALLKNLLVYSRRFIPQSVKRRLGRIFPQVHQQAVREAQFSGIDWSQTQVFTDLFGVQVYINLKGRQPEGIVCPEEYDPLREQIVKLLLNLKDEKTGAPVIKSVHRSNEFYHGPYADRVGDLLIQWDYGSPGDSLYYQTKEGNEIRCRAEDFHLHRGWAGDHCPEAIFMAMGPHIKRGVTLRNTSLYDITPTVLYLQGHPVPTDMEGKVLTEIFSEDYFLQNPIKQNELAEGPIESSSAYLDETEIRQIKNRLRDLKYIE